MKTSSFQGYIDTMSEELCQCITLVLCAEIESWIDWIDFDGMATIEGLQNLMRMRLQCLRESLPFKPYGLAFKQKETQS